MVNLRKYGCADITASITMNRIKRKIKAIFYDLDNTLYPQIEDVKQRINACVTKFFSTNREEVKNFWVKEWLDNGPKKKIIDIIYEKYKPNNNIEDIINYYRSIKTDLTLDKDVESFLKLVKEKGIKQFVITNGDKNTQLYKINRLRLRDFMDEIIVAEKDLQKPSPYYFSLLLNKYDLKAGDCVSVGDWYEVDGIASEKAGIYFVYIEGGPITEELPLGVPKIRNITDLKEIISI